MAVKRLDINIVEEFYLWGILSGTGGHRICWELNKSLNLELCRDEDVILERRPAADDAYFNFYCFEDEVNFIRIELIRNKCNGEFYSRELKNFDYLLMVKGELDFFEVEPFMSGLKEVACIQSIMQIETDKIKNPEILILE